jgi:hypothetical protein
LSEGSGQVTAVSFGLVNVRGGFVVVVGLD